MRGSDLEQIRLKYGLARKQFAPWLGISGPTLSRLEHTRGPIPKRYRQALRYLLEHHEDAPLLTPREVLAMWRGPMWLLAAEIGMTPQHLSNVICGKYEITKPLSLAIRQAVLDAGWDVDPRIPQRPSLAHGRSQ